MPLTDSSLMPSGKYVGDKMIDVPANHLIYIYENNMCSKDVRAYIHENLEVLKMQVKQAKK